MCGEKDAGDLGHGLMNVHRPAMVGTTRLCHGLDRAPMALPYRQPASTADPTFAQCLKTP